MSTQGQISGKIWQTTVKPPKKGQYGDGPFVPSREVVLFRRFSLLHVNIAKYEALLQF